MTIECYDTKCRFHNCYHIQDCGPFCGEEECHKELTQEKLKGYAYYILDCIQANSKCSEKNSSNPCYLHIEDLMNGINEIIKNEKCYE